MERKEYIDAMVANYGKARAEMLRIRPELFGDLLDNKARKLALKMAGIVLPVGLTIAYATPENWKYSERKV